MFIMMEDVSIILISVIAEIWRYPKHLSSVWAGQDVFKIEW